MDNLLLSEGDFTPFAHMSKADKQLNEKQTQELLEIGADEALVPETLWTRIVR